jgi:hypothetical protein
MCVVFIWSSKRKEKEPVQEHFFCPKCDTVSPYKVKRASLHFTFYYLPLFEIRDLDEFVVCHVCKKGFDPKILQPNNQKLFKLVWAAKCSLVRFTPETLKSKLLKDGLKEPLIDRLITLAQN